MAVAVDRLKCPGHEREQLHFFLDELQARQRRVFIGWRIEEPGEIGREPDLGDHDRMIGLGRQGFAEHSRCTRRLSDQKAESCGKR